MKILNSYTFIVQLKFILVVLWIFMYSLDIKAQHVFNEVFDIDSSTNYLRPLLELNNSNIIASSYLETSNNFCSYTILINSSGDVIDSAVYSVNPTGFETINDIYQENDSTIYLLGSYLLNNKMNSFIIKTNGNLDSLGIIHINDSLDTRSNRFLPAPNKGFYILNWFYPDSSNSVDTDVAITVLDSIGNVLEKWTYSTTFREACTDFKRTKDNGFIIAGQTDSTQSGENDFLMIKLDSLFNIDWVNTYGNNNNDIIRTHNFLELSGDGGYIICGEERTGSSNEYDGVVLKIDIAGDLEWRKNISLFSYTITKNVKQWIDGTLIISGGMTEYDSILPPFNNPRAYLTKLNANGTQVIWERYFSKYWQTNSSDYINNMIFSQDGGIIVSGWQAAFSPTLNDGWLVKFDSCGYTVGAEPEANFIIDSIVDSTVFITNLSSDYCIATLYFDNGDSLNLSAYRNQNDQIQYTFSDTGTYIPYMYAYAGDGIDTFGAKGPVIIQSDTSTGFFSFNDIEFDVDVYPNPAHDYFVVSLGSLEVNGEQDLQIRLYTPTGRLVRNYALNPDLFQQQIYTTDLISGIYLLNFTLDRRSIGNKRLSVIK